MSNINKPINENLEGVLIVEGSDDLHVVSNLFMKRSIPDAFGAKSMGSVEGVFKSIGTLIKSQQYKRIGFLVDADSDIIRRWEQIMSRVNN